MFAIIENNQIKQVGDLNTLFPNTSNPTPAFARERGAKEVAESEIKDDRFYWVSFSHYEIDGEMVKKVYTSTPKQLEDTTETPEGSTEPIVTKGLKSVWISTIKENANKELQPTDWMVIRKLERNIDIPDDVVAKRSEIVTNCNNKEVAINSANTIEELISAIYAQ